MLMNWRGIKTNCFLARTTQTLCKIPFSSALLTCLVLTSNVSSFSSSESLCKWKGLCQWTCAKLPGELGQTGKTGLFCLWSQAGGWAALQLWEASLQKREEASGGMWRVSSSGMSEHTDSQQANGSVPYFQWKIFQLQFFFFTSTFFLDPFSFSE